MNHFIYDKQTLRAEGVDLAQLAAEVGTPAFVYSQAALTEAFDAYQRAFAPLDALVCYAVKANTSRAVMAVFAGLGGGADIVSQGEMVRAMQAGVDASRIVFSGVGKTRQELRAALDAGILMFNVESAQELAALDEVAMEMGKKAPVALRVNPDVDAKTHPKITTGLAKNKFGLDVEAAYEQYLAAKDMAGVELRGISCHIGSQLTDVAPFADALARLAELVRRLAAAGVKLTHLDLGGGLGITYRDEAPPSPADYAGRVADTVRELGMCLVLEPGRSVVGNAGVLLTRVLYTKQTPAKRFVVVDAAMNDLARPSMYDAYHGIMPVRQPQGQPLVVDVVGPICETGDFLARDRELPPVEQGDLLAVTSAGAYGFSMSSTYNSRPRAAEVMVNGQRWDVVRRRETIEELTRGERLPAWLA